MLTNVYWFWLGIIAHRNNIKKYNLHKTISANKLSVSKITYTYIYKQSKISCLGILHNSNTGPKKYAPLTISSIYFC